MNKNSEHFKMIIDRLHNTYEAKNSDYGNSFEDTMNHFGLTAAASRLYDKVNRVISLTKTLNNEGRVKDESITDTLADLATYAIMTLMWIEDNTATIHSSNGISYMPKNTLEVDSEVKELIKATLNSIPTDIKINTLIYKLSNNAKDKVPCNFRVGYRNVKKDVHFKKSDSKEMYMLKGIPTSISKITANDKKFLKVTWSNVTGCNGSSTLISYYPIDEIERFWVIK